MKPDNYSSELTNSVRVTKTLETLPRGWISLSEDELIEAYNYAPRVLSRKAIKVSKIDLKGGRSSNSGVLLGEERNGNYWVMVTEKGDYWLLPKVNFRINSFNKDTVKSLFKFNGSLSEDAREFMLVELAKVSLTPGGDQWQLEERGVLNFGGTQLFQLQLELEGVKKEREKLESELRLARDERDRFASQVAELAYDRLQKTLAKLEEGDHWRSNLTDRLEQLEQAGALQEQRSSNLEAEFERLAQLKPELSKKLSQLQSQLSKLEESEINNIKMSKIGEDEREKLQNQIITLQQHLQAQTPGNNVDNKKLILQVVNDRIGEIYRQLQQEIDQRWDIKSRNLQNQINQLQQNQKLRTSDNVAGVHRESRITTNHLTSQVTPEPQMNPQIPTRQYSGSSGLQLILTYQQNPRLLSRNAIEVWETDQSIDQRRLGGGQGAILQKTRRGMYWILNEGGIDYVVPKNNIKINEYSLERVTNLFECQGYRSGYSGFKLIKPARVSAISRGETWQVVERGVLQFY